jgi:hypothetical protein
MEEQLRNKTAEVAAVKGKFKNLMLIFLVFVLGLVARKVFSQ